MGEDETERGRGRRKNWLNFGNPSVCFVPSGRFMERTLVPASEPASSSSSPGGSPLTNVAKRSSSVVVPPDSPRLKSESMRALFTSSLPLPLFLLFSQLLRSVNLGYLPTYFSSSTKKRELFYYPFDQLISIFLNKKAPLETRKQQLRILKVHSGEEGRTHEGGRRRGEQNESVIH